MHFCWTLMMLSLVLEVPVVSVSGVMSHDYLCAWKIVDSGSCHKMAVVMAAKAGLSPHDSHPLLFVCV